MSETNDWVGLKNTLGLFAIWAVVSIINSLFLALWISVQWLVSSRVITPLRPTGIPSLVLSMFQVLFAISTLAPVIITIYRDIRIMLLRTQRSIRREIEVGEVHESD